MDIKTDAPVEESKAVETKPVEKKHEHKKHHKADPKKGGAGKPTSGAGGPGAESRSRAKSTMVNNFEPKKNPNAKKETKPIETIGGDRFGSLLSMFDKNKSGDNKDNKEDPGPKKLDMGKFSAFNNSGSNVGDKKGESGPVMSDAIKKRRDEMLEQGKLRSNTQVGFDPVLEQRKKMKAENGDDDDDNNLSDEDDLHISEEGSENEDNDLNDSKSSKSIEDDDEGEKKEEKKVEKKEDLIEVEKVEEKNIPVEIKAETVIPPIQEEKIILEHKEEKSVHTPPNEIIVPSQEEKVHPNEEKINIHKEENVEKHVTISHKEEHHENKENTDHHNLIVAGEHAVKEEETKPYDQHIDLAKHENHSDI